MVADVRPDDLWADAAVALFGDALPAAERYADLLTGPAVERGLVGPAEAGRIWDRHLLNCAVVAELVPERCVLADLGSGAGLPGIVLALLRPEADIILVESMARRVAFLTECVAALELTRVQVVRGRAEDLAREISADIVTARAVAPLGKLAGWAVGLCRPGGTILAIKGAGAQTEVTDSKTLLRQLGISDLAVLQVGSDKVDPPATVVRFTAPASRGPAGGRTTVRPGRRVAGRRGDRRPSGPRMPAKPRSSGHSPKPEERQADD
jgi:16S rRNA (guanine527-N7)-methyltransferase